MTIAVFFEASGIVRDAQRPGPHIVGDVFDHLHDGWTGAIMHPTCTWLTISAAWAFLDPDFDRYPGVGYHQKVKPGTLTGEPRRIARDKAVADFKRLDAVDYPHAIENPAPSFASAAHRKPDQTVQPYQFGEDASKRTGLWLWKLPKLRPTKRIAGRIVNGVERWANQTDSGQNRLSPSDDRWSLRSDTFPGIADAIADQWGAILAGIEKGALL
jgi:hypothetical protein